jgi:hypothetical protein
MLNEVLSVTVYIIGWCLFVAVQCRNSIVSKTNSLPVGWTGIKCWFQVHAVDLALRGFFSALGYGFIVHSVATTVQSVGFHITATAIAGVGGFSANTMCYQFIGLFPGLRSEVADAAPPASQQVVPTPPLPKTPTTP